MQQLLGNISLLTAIYAVESASGVVDPKTIVDRPLRKDAHELLAEWDHARAQVTRADPLYTTCRVACAHDVVADWSALRGLQIYACCASVHCVFVMVHCAATRCAEGIGDQRVGCGIRRAFVSLRASARAQTRTSTVSTP